MYESNSYLLFHVSFLPLPTVSEETAVMEKRGFCIIIQKVRLLLWGESTSYYGLKPSCSLGPGRVATAMDGWSVVAANAMDERGLLHFVQARVRVARS